MAHPASPAPDHAHAAEHAGHHDAHHGSFMPLWLTLGTTLFLVAILAPHGVRADGTSYDYRAFAMLPGFLIMVASVAGWVREDVDELSHKPYQEGISDYLVGTIVLILSEVILFGCLFTFFFWSRAHTSEFYPEFFPHGSTLTPIIANTVILLSSGGTVHMAQLALKKDQMRTFRIWLGATILLGVAFIAGQAIEYRNLVGEGLLPTASVFGTSFFSLTGVHGLHVIMGIVALTTIWGLSWTGFIRKERASGVEGVFIYWHFVDAIWILVFSIVYLRLI